MYLKSLKIELVLDMICPGHLNDAIRLLSIFNSASVFWSLLLTTDNLPPCVWGKWPLAALNSQYPSTFTVKEGVFACFL